MDTLDTPDGGQHPSSIGDRQPSQLSTTPLLNSALSVEHQTSSESAESAHGDSENNGRTVLSNPSNYIEANVNVDHNKINNTHGSGHKSVEVVIDLNGDTSLQNGAHTKTDLGSCGREMEDDLRRRGTTIPIREEFRCRRFWFFYHDVRALTTSWLPQPVFVIYRVVVLLYMIAWLIASGVDRSPRQGVKWLIFITNHALMLLIIGFLAITTLTVAYTIVYYIDKRKLQSFHPKPATSKIAFYSQDNIAWYMKLCWILYVVGSTIQITNITGFWLVLYRPCSSDIDTSTNATVLENSTEMTDSCDTLEVISVHVHLILGLLVLVDIFLSRIPWQFLHLFYSVSYMAFFISFAGIYYAAGGTNHLNEPYIYSSFDFGENPASATGYSFMVLIAPIVMYLLLFLLVWLRDVIYSNIGCCFRDVHLSEYLVTSGEKSNGQLEPTTKVEYSITTKV